VEEVEFAVGDVDVLEVLMVVLLDRVVEFDGLNVADDEGVAELDVVKLLTGVEELEFAAFGVEVVLKGWNLEAGVVL
jgi:hypothetical protein